MPAVEKLNKPQQDELNKLFKQFKESGEGKPQPSRVTKQELENLKQAELDNIVAQQNAEEAQEAMELDLAEEKDCLAKFDDSWAEATLALKKWNEKKESLEKLNTEINTPKIVPNSNSKAVIRVCEKLIKDSNMNVYDVTVKTIGYLAKGLKRNFHDEAVVMVNPILSNIKKRPSIIQNVADTLEAILKSVDLQDIVDPILGALKDKSPVIVKTACEFLQKCVKQTYIDDLKTMYTSLCPSVVKLASHQDGELRDMGLATLGLFKGRIGDNVDKFLGDLNQQKLDKVKDSAGEYQLTKFDQPKNKPKKKAAKKKEEGKAEMTESEAMSMDVAPPKKKKKAKAKGPPASFFERQQKMESKAKDKLEEMKSELAGGAPPSKSEPAKTEAPSTSAASSEAGKARPQTAKPKKSKLVIDESGPGVQREEATDIVTEHCSAAILKKFEEAKWQEKVEGYSQFGSWLSQQEYSNDIFEASFWFIKMKQKDWKEKNVNLVKGALNCLSSVIKESQGMSKRAATIILPFFAECIGDAKYNAICKENLLSLSELVSPGFVAKGCCKHASSAKSPNVIVENNGILKTTIDEFGTQGLPVQDMISFGIV